MEKKNGTWLMRAGLCMMLAAALWAGRNLLEQYEAGRASMQALSELNAVIAQNEPNSPTEQAEPNTQTASIAPLEEPLFARYPQMEMPVERIEGHEYIGVLDIPGKGLSLPVMSDWDYDKLRVSPCRYAGSLYTGDLVIAGHNYDTHFRPIKDLSIGDELHFTDMDGNVFHFAVLGVETIGPNNVGTMLAGDWEMTLFTCTIGGQMRAAVRCRLSGVTLPQGEEFAYSIPDSDAGK